MFTFEAAKYGFWDRDWEVCSVEWAVCSRGDPAWSPDNVEFGMWNLE